MNTERPGPFRALIERGSDIALVLDADGTLRYANPAAVEHFAHQPETLFGPDLFRFVHPDDLGEQREAWDDLRAAPSGTTLTTRYRLQDGTGRWRWVRQRATNLLEDPEVAGIVVAIEDVTEQVEQQEALGQSRERLREVLENQRELLQRHQLALEAAEIGIWEHDLRTDRLYWARDPVLRSTAEVRGLAPRRLATLAAWMQVVHPEDVERVRATYEHAAEAGTPFEVEYRVVADPDDTRWVVVRGQRVPGSDPPRMIGTLRDVTSRRRAERRMHEQEERLHEVAKLTALGELAAGIAHDMGNLLMIVKGNADLLEVDIGPREELTQIRETAERGAALTRRLMSFARPAAPGAGTDDPAAVVESFAATLPRLLGRSIDVTMDIAADTPPVALDASQLEQIVLNLALNARDALPDGGRIHIRMGHDPDLSEAEEDLRKQVEIAVTDTGTGIAPEHLPRVLDPFFTTKVRGQGTGLGLAVVHANAAHVGGTVRIRSDHGQGTTVRVVLPVRPDDVAEPAPARPDRRRPTGGRRVLVCEDDVHVAGLVLQILADAGFDLMLAASGAEAVSIVRSDPGVDVILADLDLGDAHATTIMPQLRAQVGDVPVVYMSGHGEPPDDADAFLRKPVGARALLATLREILGA